MSRLHYPPSAYRVNKLSWSGPYYSCADCGQEFYKGGELREHTRTHHAPKKKAVIDNKEQKE